ncbi:MAG: TonB-dependent receptor [Proteobacteria bacterium]|nr:TonB-dependent receptor [Pseudomonadota bacterium]
MRLDRKTLLATTMIAGFTVLAPTLAAAQDQQPAPAPAASSNEVTEVVVTGSRIHRNEFNSAAPIQVITSDTATLEGLATTSEILQSSSLVAGAFQINNQLTGFVITGGPGVSTISLRGLGANRTLILVDGHRMGPAGVGGTVGPFDLNVVPASIIDRVEILKDGASSIYGSDAVAGVVNLITKKNIDGGIINASGRVTQHGGGDQYDVNAAWGKVYDRGFFNVSADYSDQMVLRRGQRADVACSADYVFNPTTMARLDLPPQPNGQPGAEHMCFNGGAGFSNVIRTGTFGDVIYPDAGMTIPTVAQGNSGGANNAGGNFGGTPTPFGLVRQARAGFPTTYLYAHETNAFVDRASIVSPTKLYSLNFRGGYDITPTTELTVGLLLNRRDSDQFGSRQFFPSFSTANPNNPFGTGLGSLLPIIPLKSDNSQQVNYANAYASLKGKFGDTGILGGWDWEIYGRASRSDGTYHYDFVYNDRVNAITGAQACNAALINISQGTTNPCTTLGTAASPFGGIPLLNKAELSGNFSAAEKAFLLGNEAGKTTYDEQEFEATMTGDLFSLPAGKVGAALGVDYRHNSLDDTPGFNNRNNNLWSSTSAGITKGSDSVKEVFGELDVPLVKGAPLMRVLNLQASGRYTDYDSYGSNSTYKVGLDWQITSWLRARATKGTSFRAPALYELFLANQTSFQGQLAIDPCIQWDQSTNQTLKTNCAAAGVPVGYTAGGSSSALITTGGGAGHLKAETSKADTLGVVFTPSFIDLSVAIDYTGLQVSNEVTRFGSANIANTCYTSTAFPANPFCALIKRAGFNAPANTLGPGGTNIPQITNVNNSYVNVANQVERAIDLTARYRHDFDFGRMQIDLQTTWDLQNGTQLFASVPAVNYAGTTYNFKGPQFSGNATVRFEHGPWTGFWAVQVIGKGSDQDLVAINGTSTRYSTTCQVTAAGGAQPVGTVAPCASLVGNSPFAVVPVPTTVKRFTEMTAYHNVSIRRTFDTWTVVAGIQNLFDERPPSLSGGFRAGTAALNGYDLFGRRFSLNITKKF